MPRMIEQLRQSAVPANTMRLAARGALDLPAPEMIEVLVFLAGNPVFGQDARMTLASWDELECLAICADPRTPREVLAYFMAPQNRRPRLIPALLDNPAVTESELQLLAQEHSHEVIGMMLASARVCGVCNVLQALAANPALTPAEQADLRQALRECPAQAEAPPSGEDAAADAELARYLTEHAAEITAEHGAAFQLIGDDGSPAPPPAAIAVPAEAAPAAAAAAKAAESERVSPLQRIAQMTVGQRVQLAMKGNKEERYILVRDGSKVVSSAVLESPKLTDQEVEMFASLKNVQESLLRGIAGKRKFMKLYAVVRALMNNPRCPLDVQVALIKNLLPNDLRVLSMNKNVTDTIRKLALKLFNEKSQKKHGPG
jgi:hypothetical protein